MFGVHSLAPAKLYVGTERKTASKSKPVMGDVQSVMSADGHAANLRGIDSMHEKRLAGPDATITLVTRDSGMGSTTESRELSPTEDEPKPTSQTTEPATLSASAGPESLEQPATLDTTQGPAPEPHTQQVDDNENRTASIDFSNPPPAEAGPSRLRAGSSHSSLQQDIPLSSSAPPRPDETNFNAIAYRRDPETVIAYLVPLPQPTVQGQKLDTEPRYFLYAPPPPHLLKPRNGVSEGYVRKLNRHWQQQVRRAQRSEQAGKRLLPHKRVHGKLVRGLTRALAKLQADDVTFLARIHPTTVNHLILIHPWALSGTQTPEEVMQTFRAQMFASKARAKRDSILSAVFFMPALAIDTLAIYFGGMAEVDGIWMLVSVTAYRTARFITRKMGPEPKTMELEQAKLIEDAKRSGFPPPTPEVEEDTEPGAVRKSMDALRRSLGSVRNRMSVSQRRSRSRKRKGGETSSTETSRPQTTEASRTDLEGFDRGELGNHAEENEAPATGAVPAAAAPGTAYSGSELSGFLEHMEEEIPDDGQPGPSGGVLAGYAEGNRTSAETNDTSSTKKKGQNFQLTFYPSPAMDVLERYVQQSCHLWNGKAYPSPTVVPTEEDVLAVVGWHPERREHNTPEERDDDEGWQTRAIKMDLRETSRKAAKAWNKSCRKQAKQQRRSKKRGLFRRRAKVNKGKGKETSASDNEPPPAEKQARSAAIKARIAAMRSKTQRKQRTSGTTTAGEPQDETAVQAQATTKKDKRGRAAGAAAILCVPCFAISERVKHRKEPSDLPSEKGARREALKQRLSSKRDALRTRKGSKNAAAADTEVPQPVAPVGLETPTDIDEAPTDTEGHTTPVATDFDENQTEVRDDAAQHHEKKSLPGKLLAIPAAIAAAIGAALKKRRDGKNKDTTAVSEDREQRGSRFSALQERFKARRTRVNKTESTSAKQSRTSGFKDWTKELRQKRKAKSASTTEASRASEEDKPKNTKEHGAVVGLIAGCVALPVAKAKQMRNKRRKTAPAPVTTDRPDVVSGTPLSPVLEEPQQRTANSDSSTFESSTADAERPATSYRAPVVEEEYEDAPETLPTASQYLPGHGQSEVPVQTGPSDARQGSSDAAVEQAARSAEPQQSREPVVVGKLKAMRAGLEGLTNRRRATGEEPREPTVDEKTSEATGGESASVGRFQGLKSGLEGFKAKRRTADSSQTVADVENEKIKPATEGDYGASGGRFKSLKEGLAGIKAKKAGAQPSSSSEKVHKSRAPGFIERMRWVWVMA